MRMKRTVLMDRVLADMTPHVLALAVINCADNLPSANRDIVAGRTIGAYRKLQAAQAAVDAAEKELRRAAASDMDDVRNKWDERDIAKAIL